MLTEQLFEQTLHLQDLHLLKMLNKSVKKLMTLKKFYDDYGSSLTQLELKLSSVFLLNPSKIAEPLKIIWERYKQEPTRQALMFGIAAELRQIARIIKNISPRDDGIKDSNPDFPWLALQQLEHLPLQLNAEVFEKSIEAILADVAELEARLKEMRRIEKLKHTASTNNLVATLYQGLKFTKSTETEINGLKNIRTVTEQSLDLKSLATIKQQLSLLEECNPDTAQGREAMLGIVQMLGEEVKNISIAYRVKHPAFPFKQLANLRNVLAHAVDKSGKYEKLADILANDTQKVFKALKVELLNLQIVIDEQCQAATQRQQNYGGYLTPVNPIPQCPILTKERQQQITKVLNIIKLAMPNDQRNTPETSNKLAMVEAILQRRMPIPFTTSEYKKFYENIMQMLGVDIVQGLNKNYDSRDRQVIKQDITELSDLLGSKQKPGVLLQQTVITLYNGNAEIKCSAIEHLTQALIQAPEVGSQKVKSRREGLFNRLLNALEKIQQHTQAVIEAKKDDPNAIREACRADKQLHHAVLYYLTVIGQCIQSIKNDKEFQQFASVTLRKEFEALRWIRNSLMHSMPVDETRSVLRYYTNDLLHSPLNVDGGRAFDTQQYLQELKQNINQFLAKITAPPAKVEADEESFIKTLALHELKAAYLSGNNKLIVLWLEFLGIEIEPDAEVSKVARDLLDINTYLTLRDVYAKQKELKLLCQHYDITILGVFGQIIEEGYFENEASGFLISLKGKYDLAKHAAFKAELENLFGKNLLSVTEDNFYEYASAHGLGVKMDVFLQKIKENHSLDQVISGYELNSLLCRFKHNNEKLNLKEITNYLLEQKPALNLLIDGYRTLDLACMLESEEKLAWVKLLLEHGADPNAFDKHGKAAMHYAAEENDIVLLKLLIEYGGEVNLASRQGRTPIEYADSEYHNDVYEWLKPLSQLAPEKRLRLAIYNNDIQEVNNLLSTYKQIKLNQPDEQGDLPLHIACEHRKWEIIELLLKAGAKPDVIDSAQQTALHILIAEYQHGDFAKVISLIDRFIALGVNPNCQDNSQQTPLHKAVFSREPRLVYHLVTKHGADPNIQDNYKFHPLLWLLNSNCRDRKMVKALVNVGSSLILQNKYVGNALHAAAERNHPEAAKILLASDADPYVISLGEDPKCKNKTALQIAIKYNHHKVAKIIRTWLLNVDQDAVARRVDMDKSISDEEMTASVFGSRLQM